MDRIRRLFSTTNRCGMGLGFSVRSAVLLLQILQHATREGSEGLKRRPTQLLLLTQRWRLSDQTVMLTIEALTVWTLTGLFRQSKPSVNRHHRT